MATTIWSNKELYHWGNTGYIKMDATYTYSRDGADMLYTINVTVKQTGSKAYFNDSVGCQIKLNGTEVYKNTTLKGSTSSSTTSWSKTAKVTDSRVSNKTSGTTSLSVRVWDSQGAADFDKTNTANLTVSPAMPVLTVGTPSVAINYANFTIIDSTSQTMTNYQIANSSGTVVQSGTLNSSSATIKFSEISGTRLSANTTYSGYKIRAQNAIGWGDYATIPDFKTLDIPTASTSGNFNIGSNTTINISTDTNISSWSVTASDGTSTKSGTGSGTSCTVAVSDSSYVTNMLNNHSSATSWTMTYTVSFNSDGASVGSRTVTNTCSIPSGSYNPTFASSRVSYADINQTTKTITGSDAKIIKGYSNVKFSVNTMTPATGASASKYKVTANGTTQEATHTGNMLYFTFNNITTNSYSAQAIDSRNKSTTISGTYSTFIQYVQPAFTSNSTKRTNSGIGTNVNINATASYYVWSGLSQNNTITSVQYKIGQNGTLQTIPISGYTINNGTVSINYNTTGDSFVQANTYTVYIYVTDKLATRETSVTIPSAQPLLWKDRANKRLGIKKKPDYTLDVDGSAKVSGDLITGTFNGRPWNFETADTTNTWVPVAGGGQWKHRVIPSDYNNAPSTLSVNRASWGNTLEAADGRIANANITHYYNNDKAHLKLLIASSSMTSNKPKADGYILACNWDNSSQYAGQLHIPNGGNTPMQFRGCSSGTWGAWEDVHRCKVLYNDATGSSTGSVTLSESASNFEYIEAFVMFSEPATVFSTKVYTPSTNKIQLTGHYDNGTRYYIETAIYSFSGTTMTRTSSIRWRFSTGGAANTRADTTSSGSSLKLMRVIGYR